TGTLSLLIARQSSHNILSREQLTNCPGGFLRGRILHADSASLYGEVIRHARRRGAQVRRGSGRTCIQAAERTKTCRGKTRVRLDKPFPVALRISRQAALGRPACL